MVEAAGVEPASAKGYFVRIHMLLRFVVSGNCARCYGHGLTVEAKYVIQSGSLKDMSLRVRQATTRATDFESDLDEVRLIVEYPLQML